MKSAAISEESGGGHAGDILLVPLAVMAFWTLAYHLVLIVRWPAKTITWCGVAIAVVGFSLLWRVWKKREAVPGRGYRFHGAHLLLIAVGSAYATTALFVRRPNQDDVVYFHRALSQLLALDQPVFLHQTSVDMAAAAFSPVHLATSYEMLVAFLGHYLGIDPLYGYQVIAHALVAFALPFVLYWCARIFGFGRCPAALGAVLGIGFLLLADESPFGALLGAGVNLVAGKPLESIDTAGMLGFATVSGYLWQGKPIVWLLVVPMSLALTYRFLSHGNGSDLVWLILVSIAGVGLSNPALYLVPAVIGCSWLAFVAVEFVQHKTKIDIQKQVRRGLLLIIPMIYPIAILALLSLNIIPQPTDLRMFGPRYRPWRESLDYVIGSSPDYWRAGFLMIAVPLLIVRGRAGLFVFFYLCAVWLLCLNPLLAPWWMKNIFAYTYFRLFYLLQLPLLCTLVAAAGPRLIHARIFLRDRLLVVLVLLALVVSSCYGYQGISISPKDPTLGVGWKSPKECQLLPANIEFAQAAGKYIAHSKLLAPNWTASCELPLLLPEMKVVAPRLVTHYFSNAGNPQEGILRQQAQAFVEGIRPGSPNRLDRLEPRFRQVIESGRANAVAVPEKESDRVLATLQSIDPGWHAVLKAGGMVLMLPATDSTAV